MACVVTRYRERARTCDLKHQQCCFWRLPTRLFSISSPGDKRRHWHWHALLWPFWPCTRTGGFWRGWGLGWLFFKPNFGLGVALLFFFLRGGKMFLGAL